MGWQGGGWGGGRGWGLGVGGGGGHSLICAISRPESQKKRLRNPPHMLSLCSQGYAHKGKRMSCMRGYAPTFQTLLWVGYCAKPESLAFLFNCQHAVLSFPLVGCLDLVVWRRFGVVSHFHKNPRVKPANRQSRVKTWYYNGLPRTMQRIKQAAALTYAWDYPLRSFIYRGLDCGSLEQGSLHYTPEHCLVNCGFPLFWC